MLKALLIALGTVALGLGLVGIVVPGLPTTPFLLLAAALYVRSSPRLYARLMDSPTLGPYIRQFQQEGLTPRKLAASLAVMWSMIAVSTMLLIERDSVQLAVVAVGLVGTVAMGTVTLRRTRVRRQQARAAELPQEWG